MMRNVLKTSFYVLIFAVAGIFFQISCSNSDDAASPSTEQFVFVKKDFPTTGEQSIWISNVDGTGQTQIPITLPSGFAFYSIYGSGEHSTARLTQAGLVLFTAQKSATNESYIYSCETDGSNVQQVAAFDPNTGVFL